ncbi:MAG: YbgC/FadM family acyl-CoA thioesterase [Legionellaceae bacterium]|nr:YbgC/FadM family acyl-CoA thioesterase [Legionellaceae bacterium]
MSNKEFLSSYRVYVEDTDLMGIIYHGKYLYFFERARTDLLREMGISLTTMAKYDTFFAIRDVHVRYISPGRLDDMLTIKTYIEKMKGCTLQLVQKMFNQDNTLLAEARVQAVTVDKLLKPKRALSEIMGGIKNG